MSPVAKAILKGGVEHEDTVTGRRRQPFPVTRVGIGSFAEFFLILGRGIWQHMHHIPLLTSPLTRGRDHILGCRGFLQNEPFPFSVSLEHGLKPGGEIPVVLHLQAVQVLIERDPGLDPETYDTHRDAGADKGVEPLAAIVIGVGVG